MANSDAALFVERTCPACDSGGHSLLFEVVADDFAPVNSTYRLDRLAELEIAADRKCPIVRCDDCGFVYSRFRLNDVSTKFVYEQVIDHEKSRAKIFGREKRLRLLTVWRRLFVEATRQFDSCELSVLDFGCGWGDFLSVAQSPGVSVHGLETDQQKRDWGRQQNLHVVAGLQELESESPFDILYCDQVLEHLDTPAISARQMFRHLKPGGVAFVGVPCCTDALIEDVRVRLQHGQPISKDINPWEHLNYFSPDSLVQMMQSAGFEILNSAGPNQSLSWKRWWPWHESQPPPAATTSLFCRRPLHESEITK